VERKESICITPAREEQRQIGNESIIHIC